MNKIEKNMNSIVICLLEIGIGVLLLIKPIGFTTSILLAFGFLLFIAGLGDIAKYFRLDDQQAAISQMLFKGITLAFAGIFIVNKYKWLLSTFPIVTVVYGVCIS